MLTGSTATRCIARCSNCHILVESQPNVASDYYNHEYVELDTNIANGPDYSRKNHGYVSASFATCTGEGHDGARQGCTVPKYWTNCTDQVAATS